MDFEVNSEAVVSLMGYVGISEPRHTHQRGNTPKNICKGIFTEIEMVQLRAKLCMFITPKERKFINRQSISEAKIGERTT